MFPKLIAREIAHRGLSLREAAREIGLNSHGTLVNALAGKSVDIDTAYLICKWLNVPLSAAVDTATEDEKTIAAIAIVLNSAPELKKLFVRAADEVSKGNLPIEDFKEIVNFASWQIQKGFDQSILEGHEINGKKHRKNSVTKFKVNQESRPNGQLSLFFMKQFLYLATTNIIVE